MISGSDKKEPLSHIKQMEIDGERFALIPLKGKPLNTLKQEIRLFHFTFGRSTNDAGKELEAFLKSEGSLLGA